MFATEFFKNLNKSKDQDVVISFVETVLPSVLFKTVYDKVFISKEAKSAITFSLESCHSKETLSVLINDGCLCKANKKLQELSYEFIGVFVKSSEKTFFEGNTEITEILVNQLLVGVDSVPRIKKASTEVFKEISSKIGKEKFEELLKASFKLEPSEEESKQDLPYDDAKVQ